MWGLFLDDERYPSDKDPLKDWVIARTVNEAQDLIRDCGMPYRMSLDHDLGDGIPTGYDFIKWLVEQDMDDVIDIDVIIYFYVHSQNPVGAENIRSYFNTYISQKER